MSEARYAVRAVSESKGRFALVGSSGEFAHYEEIKFSRDRLKVREAGLRALEQLVNRVSLEPTSFGLPSDAIVNIQPVVGSFITTKEGMNCPSCESNSLDLSWEGKDIESGKLISVERCSNCLYQNFAFVTEEKA